MAENGVDEVEARKCKGVYREDQGAVEDGDL